MFIENQKLKTNFISLPWLTGAAPGNKDDSAIGLKNPKSIKLQEGERTMNSLNKNL